MGINPIDLREVIVDTLTIFDNGKHLSLNAVRLLMMTAATESHCGTYLKQVYGPALGVFQMEPETAKDIMVNFVRFRPFLHHAVYQFVISGLSTEDNLKANLPYQVVMARIHYMRDPKPIPNFMDIDGLAKYYKRVWNTYKGKAEVSEVVANYFKYGKI